MRTPLVPAAIAVGAMTPDLPLFLRGGPLSYQATHTNLALSTGVALVLLLCWYAVLRPATRELAPLWLARRLPGEWDATGAALWRGLRAPRPGARSAIWQRPLVWVVVVVVSLALGAVSHVVWDAFTHAGRWGTRLLPALDAQWGPLSGFTWVQHGSSVLGLVILLAAAARWLARRPESSAPVRLLARGVRVAWICALPVLLVGALLVGLIVYGPLTAEWTIRHLAYRVLPPACAIWGALTLLLCLVVVVMRRRGSRA